MAIWLVRAGQHGEQEDAENKASWFLGEASTARFREKLAIKFLVSGCGILAT
jgi:hypothetical protein